MLTFGASAYLWLYAPERLTRALSPAVRRLALIAASSRSLTAILWLALEVGGDGGRSSAAVDPDTFGGVLTDTAFGHAWAAHLILAAALVAARRLRPAQPMGADGASYQRLCWPALALLATPRCRPAPKALLHRANHAVHLLTAGAWLGGLIPFACASASTGTRICEQRRSPR